MVFVLAGIMWFHLGRANAKKDARNTARGHDWTAEEKKPFEDDGDDVDWFRYTL